MLFVLSAARNAVNKSIFKTIEPFSVQSEQKLVLEFKIVTTDNRMIKQLNNQQTNPGRDLQFHRATDLQSAAIRHARQVVNSPAGRPRPVLFTPPGSP